MKDSWFFSASSSLVPDDVPMRNDPDNSDSCAVALGQAAEKLCVAVAVDGSSRSAVWVQGGAGRQLAEKRGTVAGRFRWPELLTTSTVFEP